MELGAEWVRKNERTVYRPLVGQNVHPNPSGQASTGPPLTELDREGAHLLQHWAGVPAGEARPGLLDLRPEAAFDAGHIDGATCLPWGEAGEVLVARAHELPPRGAALALYSATLSTLQAAASHLSKSGYAVQFGLYAPDEQGAATVESAGLGWSSDSCSIRLWTASPCLSSLLPDLPSASAARPSPLALDIGCGSGRDCVWLAQHGWHCIGVDHLDKMLQRYRLLAKHARPRVAWAAGPSAARASPTACSGGEEGLVTGGAMDSGCSDMLANVERWWTAGPEAVAKTWAGGGGGGSSSSSPPEPEPETAGNDCESGWSLAILTTPGPQCGVDLVHISHYLHRPLLRWVRQHPTLVRVGGCVVVHTFMRGCELIGRPTKPRFLLEAGELRNLFSHRYIYDASKQRSKKPKKKKDYVNRRKLSYQQQHGLQGKPEQQGQQGQQDQHEREEMQFSAEPEPEPNDTQASMVAISVNPSLEYCEQECAATSAGVDAETVHDEVAATPTPPPPAEAAAVEPRWEVVRDEVGPISDGRPLSFFMARRIS